MTLQDKALLVKLSISIPGNTRKDVRVTQDTISSHNMGQNAGRWLKQLYPDKAFKPLIQIQGEIRTWHYENTLPWQDDGYRILPSTHHSEYTDAMRGFRTRFESTQADFVSHLPDHIEWAKTAHNGTFDISCYPKSEHELNRKFGLSLDFSPVPSGSDFRCYIDSTELAAMSAQVDGRIQEATELAHLDLWHRLKDPIACMVERLSNPDSTFRDSLISNLKDVIALIPKLNITRDASLQAFAYEAETKLATYSPDLLRTSKSTRSEAAQAANEILSRMAGYFPVTS